MGVLLDISKFMKEHLVPQFFLSSSHPFSLCRVGRQITLLRGINYHSSGHDQSRGHVIVVLNFSHYKQFSLSFNEQIHVLIPLFWYKALNKSKQKIKTQSAIKTQQFKTASLPCFPLQFILLPCVLTLNHSIIQLKG